MTAFDAIVNFCEELGWVHFFQTLFNIGETMPCSFQGTVMSEILHVREKKNTEWVAWHFAVWTEDGVPETSLTPTSELTEMLVLEPDQVMWWC